MEFAHDIMRHPSVPPIARREFLDDIRRNSVFRIWRYSAGVGCRPHYDPGLCTALLRASAPGLQLNLREELPPLPGRPGSYRNDAAGGDKTLGGLLSAWEEPQPTARGDDTLLLRGRMAHVISGGALPAVLHCVRSDWAKADGEVRYSFVVELRPSDPHRWYGMNQSATKGEE